MRSIIIIFLLVSANLFGQPMAEKDIEKYTSVVDSLRSADGLEELFCPNMSGCGGAVYGYYKQDSLWLIESIYQAEMGYSSKTIYFKDTNICKIVYREHSADWEKYDKDYPQLKAEFDATKMTYTDTLYTIVFGKEISFIKSSDKDIISKTVDMELIKRLIYCGRKMRYQLETEGTSR